MKRIWPALLLVALLAGGGYGYNWYTHLAEPASAAASPAARQAAPGVPVVTRLVEQKPMPVDVAAIGTVQPIATVAIKSRIDSEIMQVHVAEGQEVKQGDLLFMLDVRGPQAQLRIAEASLERDKAQLEKAKQDVARYTELLKRDYTPRTNLDQAVALANQLEAQIKSDIASIDAAKLILAYATIRSPIDGRIGAIAFKRGNLVKNNDTTSLATITQLRPIYVTFSVAEGQLLEIQKQMATKAPPIVQAIIPGDRAKPAEGQLSFVDSTIDPATGTIQLRAAFPNADTRLWPGQFVRVSMRLRMVPDALVVASDAVQAGQSGPFVFLVKADQTVEPRNIAIAWTSGEETVIADGLKAGERVVVDGQLRITTGSKVTERGAAANAAPNPAAAGGKGQGQGQGQKQ
ncbi:MAG: efflux RND transporter periplasmic adaptor subunit [Proteobacteria bacterium]|nr:efflux RND transporter periplasmic adaptor subunit [Pseudomonadota bacterium]MBI3497126.1 efflux RND transporter periplasmic adaptor subunit [Pseudomonadota bacterium]